MPIPKRRSRTVSFRLSDEEFNFLKSTSERRGARSVSEFTRSVACTVNDNEGVTIEERLRLLNDHIELLDRTIHYLAEAMKNKNGADGIDSPGLNRTTKFEDVTDYVQLKAKESFE
jgi:hypothetical protein